MKGHDRYVPKNLYPQFLRLNVHVWGRSLAAADLIEHGLECLLKFRAPICSLWDSPGVKHGRIIIEGHSETFPIKIIKCPNELGECIFDLRFHRCGSWLRKSCRDEQS